MKTISEQIVITLLLFLGIIFVTIGNYIAYKKEQSLFEANRMVHHTYQVIETAENASITFVTHRTDILNNILNKQQLSLINIQEKMKEVKEQLRALRLLTIDNPRQQKRITELENLLEKNLDSLQNLFLIETTRNHELAIKYVTSMAHQDLRKFMINKFKEIINEEKNLLEFRKFSFNQETEDTNFYFFFTSVLSECLLIITFIMLYHHLKKRKKAEKKVAESETHLRLIIDNTKDYAILMLNPEGNVYTWSKGAEKIIGYKRNEIINKYFSQLYPSDENQTIPFREKLKIAEVKGTFEEETWLTKKDGGLFWANSIITSLYNEKGELLGFSQIIRDLTERLNNEKIKRELISVVSHELRTPLTSIFGSLNLLISQTNHNFSSQTKKLLEIAYQNCERLLSLINDILDVDKIESDKMEFNNKVVEVNELIQESVKTNQIFGEKYGVKIIFNPIAENYYIKVDPQRLLQILTNLISNAVKFSDKNSQVEIRLTPKGKKIRISIHDYGAGIPQEFQKKIFQRFAQADASISRAAGGSGLGLNISKSLVEKMGGELKFESSNKGTTFYFELPLEDLSYLQKK